ncbi:MAG: hypothetical protein JWN67_4391, partial [Actinomycetia bacterium]|nr:hypothetical protein [Actinomycetes bacterium]
MASTSPEGDAAVTPLAGTVQVAAGLHARRIPLLATPRNRVLVGIGDVGRAARRFSALTGLSLSARRAMQAQRSDVGRQPIRPPDYWTGYQEEEEERAARTSTGDAALDKLIARRATAKREAAARPRPQRGLPSTIHRRSHSIAGPMTAPGGMARRLLPATVVPAANPANSPQTAASREPRAARPTRPARPGQGDRPRPAAPPATTTAARTTTSSSPAADAVQRSAERAASSASPAVDAVRRTARLDGSTPVAAAGLTPPAGRDAARRGIDASSASASASASSPGRSFRSAPGQPDAATASASSAAARRSAAPSELDPGVGAGAVPDWVGGSTAAGAVPFAGSSSTGSSSTGSPSTGSSSTGSPSTVAASLAARSVARSAGAEADVSDVEVAPPWPGDLPEVAEVAASPFAAATIGRKVAVRPLLAGWRAPTAWRSIAAAPGLRLLPVGPAGLPTAWSSTAAGSEQGTSSWADTVRRVVSEASSGPGAVRNLPVGGPTVVVREVASSEGSAARGRSTGPDRASTTGATRAGDRAVTSPTSAAADRAGTSRSSERAASTAVARAADRATAAADRAT